MSTRGLSSFALVGGLLVSIVGFSPDARADDCVGLVHAASISSRDVRWESRVRCWAPTVAAGSIRFAYPLPIGTRIETTGIAPTFDAGRIVGATLSIDAVRPDGTVRFVTRMPRSAARGRLVAPLLAGSIPQVVGLVSPELEFDPDASHDPRIGEHRLTYVGDVDERRPWDLRRLASDVGIDGDRFVVSADATVVSRGGIVGELDTRTHRHRGLRAVLVGLVLLSLGGFAVVYRRLRMRAEAEEADALLDEEFRALDAGALDSGVGDDARIASGIVG